MTDEELAEWVDTWEHRSGAARKTAEQNTAEINRDGRAKLDLYNRMLAQKLAEAEGIAKEKRRLIAAAMNLRDQSYSSGVNAATGLGDGIKSKAWYPVEQAGRMALNVINRTRATLQERSPSRVFGQSGRNAVLGLAQGMLSEEQTALRAADHLISGLMRTMDDVVLPTPELRSVAAVRASNRRTDRQAGNPVTTRLDDLRGAVEALQGMGVYIDGRIAGQVLAAGQTSARRAVGVMT